jgi:hypothetical protein
MASAIRVTRSVYRYKSYKLKVDRIEADIERIESSEDYIEVVSSAAYKAVS